MWCCAFSLKDLAIVYGIRHRTEMADEICFMCGLCAHVVADAGHSSCSNTPSIIQGLVLAVSTIEVVATLVCGLSRPNRNTLSVLWAENQSNAVRDVPVGFPLLSSTIVGFINFLDLSLNSKTSLFDRKATTKVPIRLGTVIVNVGFIYPQFPPHLDNWSLPRDSAMETAPKRNKELGMRSYNPFYPPCSCRLDKSRRSLPLNGLAIIPKAPMPSWWQISRC